MSEKVYCSYPAGDMNKPRLIALLQEVEAGKYGPEAQVEIHTYNEKSTRYYSVTVYWTETRP